MLRRAYEVIRDLDDPRHRCNAAALSVEIVEPHISVIEACNFSRRASLHVDEVESELGCPVSLEIRFQSRHARSSVPCRYADVTRSAEERRNENWKLLFFSARFSQCSGDRRSILFGRFRISQVFTGL